MSLFQELDASLWNSSSVNVCTLMAAADFFTHCYTLRSNIVHGNMPYQALKIFRLLLVISR